MPEGTSNQNLIELLLDNNQPFPPRYLHIFSDMTRDDLEIIKSIWARIAVEKKINLLQDLEELLEADTLLSFDDLARFALSDEDPHIRCHAINLLWECEDSKLALQFGDMLKTDDSEIVRAAAAAALGKFVLMGELEEIPRKTADLTLDLLLKMHKSEHSEEVQREIMKSLSYSGKEEIAAMIQAAYSSNKKAWKVAALEAMGRSADERWENEVFKMITNPDAEYQFEAIRAAGELEIKNARPILLDMLAENSASEEMRCQIIWSLSKIGGEDVRETLQELLENSEDDEETEMLEMALDNLDFMGDIPPLDII